MKKPVKAILFDYDDTLVKTRETVWEAHKHTAKKYYDLDLTDEDIKVHWGRPYTEMLGDIYNHVDTYEGLHRNYKTVRLNYPMKVFDESVSVVNQLVTNYLVGIVTAANLELVMFDLNKLEFPLDSLVFIQTAEDTQVHKPDSGVFKPALKKLAKKKIEPHEVLYVGDDIRDYQAASGAGLQFVGIVRGETNPFIEDKIKTIKSLSELLENKIETV